MRLMLAIITAYAFSSPCLSAEFGLGVNLDSSTNMLLRPGGKSGIIANVFGNAGVSRGNLHFSYDMDVGAVERYEGVQFHSHEVGIDFGKSPSQDLETLLGARGAVARYGEVSVLGGYSELLLLGALRYTPGESSLLRWESNLANRDFLEMEIENYLQAESSVRFDRYLETGTTLRAQMKLGVRRYTVIKGDPMTGLFTLHARIAQSAGAKTGLLLELRGRFVGNESSPDTSAAYERRLFEDEYKSSGVGGEFRITHLLKNRGTAGFSVTVERKRFGKNLTSSYYYLPENGWKEWEHTYTLTFSPRPDFLSGSLRPKFEIYHISTDSSIAGLSYRSTGFSLGLTMN